MNRLKLTIAAKASLVFASLVFYSWWNVIYLPLLIGSLLFNYAAGILLSQKSEKNLPVGRRTLLIVGLLLNIGLLGYFKYADFFLSNVNQLLGSDIALLHLVLPLAISFFTFQQIAYLVDCYRMEITETDFLNYALFITFFPQLIAGPIVHHKEMMPQFASKRTHIMQLKNIGTGLFIFSIGLFKKTVIADTFAVWATFGFDHTDTLNMLAAWTTSLSYTFQLYFDFSGYTDMAIGLALLFNIRLPINFYSPYKSTSLIEVWNRWHITLSKFVNMYIFNPIVRSFKHYSFTKGMTALLLSMMIIGLWHGASWMFVFFGLMHGAGLVVNHIWKKKIRIKIHPLLGWFLTFNFLNISMVFFRATSLSDAFKVLGGMFSGPLILPHFPLAQFGLSALAGLHFGQPLSGIHGSAVTVIWFTVGFLLILGFKNSIQQMEAFRFHTKTLLMTMTFFVFGVLSIARTSEFLYFNF